MARKIFIIFIVILFSLSIVKAEWKYNPFLDDIIKIMCKIPFLCKGDLIPLDYYEPTNTTADVNVNQTDFWDNLDDPSDILTSELDNDAGFITNTYNSSYDAKPDNNYNATYDAKPDNNYNSSYEWFLNTTIFQSYNSSYDAKPDNNYNATYDAKPDNNYNSSYDNYNNTFIRKDGTEPLNANWDVGSFNITASGFTLGDNEIQCYGDSCEVCEYWNGTDKIEESPCSLL